MQTQKLDFNKPHGVVYGHAAAMYEQDGALYAGDGTPIIGNAAIKSDTSVEEPIIDLEQEKEFLKNLLRGGEMLQTNVAKEAENMDLNWSQVKNASIELNILKTKQGNYNVWKLDGESA